MSLKLSLCLLSPLFIDYRQIRGDDTKGTHFELVQQILFCYNRIRISVRICTVHYMAPSSLYISQETKQIQANTTTSIT